MPQKKTNPKKKILHADFFTTHSSIHAQRLHAVSEAVLLPARWFTQLLARVIQPNPGANKGNLLRTIVIRLGAVIGMLLLSPFALICLPFGLLFRKIDLAYRPFISHFYDPAATTKLTTLTEENPLHIRTHNLGFVPTPMEIVGDLRPAIERAKEVVSSILNDPDAPDVICFQEAFSEDATKILCEGLITKYPHIVHSVSPHISGFNSGAMIVSKYPLYNIRFKPFEHMVNPDKIAPRGILSACLQTTEVESSAQDISIYNVHLQALLGHDRAQARVKQIQDVHNKMRKVSSNLATWEGEQVLVGDFNTSRVTAWGEDNMSPPEQAEKAVLTQMTRLFQDPYLENHDALTGKRTSGKPSYLEKDNARMKVRLPEPSGSWYHGPFADKGIMLKHQLEADRKRHHYQKSEKVTEICMAPVTWGTKAWHRTQTANTARFDYVLLTTWTNLKADVEIRRVCVPDDAQSASTDHLPVDAKVYRSQPIK